MITRTSSLTDVAFEVCTALDRSGTRAVLTGGSAATVYAPAAYQSLDLDFVVQFKSNNNGEQVLNDLGYHLKSNHYVHRENELILEFPPGPLQVGSDLVESWNTMRRADDILHILNPTDCCRDRLANFLHWNDWAGLEQAVAVAQAELPRIDFTVLKDWCDREGQTEKFTEFHKTVNAER